MNNLKRQVLESAYARPGYTIGGLADTISRGRRTEEEIRDLVEKGYSLDVTGGIELSKKAWLVSTLKAFEIERNGWDKGLWPWPYPLWL